MNNIDILEEPKDILFEIDMKLYDEFNDKFCEIEENLGTVYSYKDLEDLKKVESDTEKTLLRETISTLIAENKELKEKNKRYEEIYKNYGIDDLVQELEKYRAENKELKEENENLRNTNKKLYELAQRTAAQLFIEEDYVKKSKVEEIIHNNKPHIAQEKLQSLLGKE